MVGPLGYCQQLAGLPGKAFLGESRELGQVVVGDQRFVLFGGFASIDKLLPLLGQALGIGRLKAHPLLL